MARFKIEGAGYKPSKIKNSVHKEEIDRIIEESLERKETRKAILAKCQKLIPDLKYSNIRLYMDQKSRGGGLDKRRVSAPREDLFGLTFTQWKKGLKSSKYFAETILGLRLHAGQKRWFRVSDKNGKNILVPGNQFGKSFVIAIKHIRHNFYKLKLMEGRRKYNPDILYETLNISPAMRQVKNVYLYTLQILQSRVFWETKSGDVKQNKCKIKGFLEKPFNVPVLTQISSTPVEFNNNTFFHNTSTGGDQASRLAGGQFAYISYDECPLSKHLEDELGGRIMTRLVRYGGDLDLVGTPDVDTPESFMYHQRLVEKGIKQQDGWRTVVGSLNENIFIPKKNRDKIMKTYRSDFPEKYHQFVHGKFIKGGSAIFTPEMVKSIFLKEELGHINDYRKEKDPVVIIEPKLPGHLYVMGCDFSVAGDYTCYICLDHTGDFWYIVGWYYVRGNSRAPAAQIADLLRMKAVFNAELMLDSAGLGGLLIKKDLKDLYPCSFNFGPGRKSGFIRVMVKALNYKGGEGRVKAPLIPELEEQLGAYSIEGEKKLKTDAVMALGLALWYPEMNPTLPEALDVDILAESED